MADSLAIIQKLYESGYLTYPRIAFLAGTAGENVLNCVVEYMPHVQHARHVGRGNDNAVGRFVRMGVSVEATL